MPRFEDGISLRLLAWFVGLFVGTNPVFHYTALRSVCAALAITGVSAALTAPRTHRTTWLLCFFISLTTGAAMPWDSIDTVAVAAVAWFIWAAWRHRLRLTLAIGLVLMFSRPEMLLSGAILTSTVLWRSCVTSSLARAIDDCHLFALAHQCQRVLGPGHHELRSALRPSRRTVMSQKPRGIRGVATLIETSASARHGRYSCSNIRAATCISLAGQPPTLCTSLSRLVSFF